MMSIYDNCTNCFRPLGGKTVCPYCGYDPASDKKYVGVLPPFTLLNNRYLVGHVLGKGGFGVTYIAKDILGNGICAIKEYMPTEYSSRSGGSMTVVPFEDDKSRYVFSHGREKFMEEAKTLLKLQNNPIVVDILDYFTQNNTAYLVMEYLDGQDIRKMARLRGGKLDPEFAKTILVTVASSLMEIHRLNILHRDLSPENIIVTSDGRIKLIDFGAARNFVSRQNKGLSILLKPGFAPPEQYSAKGAQGPWSDVYALCATFYTIVSGKPLVDALFRYRGEQQPSLISLGCPVTKKTSDVIEKGMELDYQRRYKNFKELLDDIDIATVKKTPAPSPIPATPQKQNVIPSSVNSQGPKSQQRTTKPPGTEPNPNNYTPPVTSPVKPPVSSKVQYSVAAVVGSSFCNPMQLSTADILKIGRSAQSCRYVVSGDTNISRIHCYLRFDGNNVFLCDNSSNGTFFENGTRLIKNKEYPVTSGTRFFLATRNHMFVIKNR